MLTVETIDELRTIRGSLEEPVGFVPTMGYLHDGHLSLVRRASSECASVVVSIFVNPTQFGPQEDLSSYPRDLDKDLHLLKNAQVDLVWIPTQDVMYPDGYQTWVVVDKISRPLEGAMRPAHFRGVSTVVAKLFNAVQPQVAYFGQKDAQQVAVIRCMVADLNFPIRIVTCPTIRDPDGLAMSSRNAYLNQEERKAATVLYRSLTAAREAYKAGVHEAITLKSIMTDILASEPLAHVQYVSIASLDNLTEIEGVFDEALCSMAVFIGKTRLIDNIELRKESEG